MERQKKALQLASVASMIGKFNMPNIRLLQEQGYHVDVVANFRNPGGLTRELAESLKKELAETDVNVHDIEIPRSLNPLKILKAYKVVKKLTETEHYDLIHCHSPIGSVICRLAARKERKKGTKVIYTAHGFHFYKGAPLFNWLIYYTIEKILARITDVLITINREDYQRANEKLKAGRIEYVPGIGVDTDFFKPDPAAGKRIREELGLSDKDDMILSVGELNKNKNHIRVIRALKGQPFTYVIVGEGDQKSVLQKVAIDNNVDVRFLGFREDVSDIYNAADVYVLPSLREGLNVSLMEAMACGCTVACSDIRGNRDLIENALFDPKSEAEIRTAILKTVGSKDTLGRINRKKIMAFGIQVVRERMRSVYNAAPDQK